MVDYFPGRPNPVRREQFSIKADFGAEGDNSTDDYAALQAAASSGLRVYLDPGIYLTSAEITFSNGTQFIGAGAYHGLRNNGGEDYDADVHTVIKSDGITGTDSCVVRMSKKAVGVEATDLTPPGTDDLYSAGMEGITVDANNEADIAIYCYRMIDCVVNSVAACKAVERGWIIIGCFTNTWMDCSAYSNEKNGWEIGKDVWSFSSTDEAVNACTFLRPVARYNGTGLSYDETSNVTEGHGFFLQLNRGNVFVDLVSESNDGAGIYLKNSSSNFGGPNKFVGGYVEFNQEAVLSSSPVRGTAQYNIIFENSRTWMRHLEFDGTFVHPDGGIWISGSTSPADAEAFPRLRNCYFSGTIDINAGTPNFRVENCSPAPNYVTYRPDVQELSGAGAVDILNYKTEWTTTGTNAGTLADGVREGQRKLIVIVSDGGTGTLTPTSFGDGTSAAFADLDDWLLLEWINGNWWVIANQGVAIS